MPTLCFVGGGTPNPVFLQPALHGCRLVFDHPRRDVDQVQTRVYGDHGAAREMALELAPGDARGFSVEVLSQVGRCSHDSPRSAVSAALYRRRFAVARCPVIWSPAGAQENG